MGWIRIDDNAPHHRKMLQAGPAACWLWVCGLGYCQRMSSDGFIPLEAMSLLGVWNWKKLAGFLVSARMWHKVDGGYEVHDYLHYQFSAGETAERRERHSDERAAAGRLGGIKSGETRRSKTKQNEANASKQNEANAGSKREASEAPSHPIPSHKREHHPRVFDKTHAQHIYDFCQFVCFSEQKANEFAKLLPRGLSDPENFNRVIAWAETVRDGWGDKEIPEMKWWDFWEARWKERRSASQDYGDIPGVEETRRRYLSTR